VNVRYAPPSLFSLSWTWPGASLSYLTRLAAVYNITWTLYHDPYVRASQAQSL